MTSRADDNAGVGAGGVSFVRVYHTNASDDDGGVGTPEGFQNTPDQWHSAKKRGLTDAVTQRDSQATQVATEVQSFDTQAARVDGASWNRGPSFVDATGSLSGDGSSPDRRQDDVDEDETQIIMSLSQDRGAMRKMTRHIEEEELETMAPPDALHGDPSATTGEASDADSDMSDDMLEQDGDINGLSSIAKNFQLSEAEFTQEKKPAVNVYKPRMPFQITSPASVAGGEGSAEDDSSGAETEVDEEPETTQTFGTSKAGATEEPPPLSMPGKKGFLGNRSVSETAATQTEEKKPKRYTLDRSVSCSDVEVTPERSKRARVSLVKLADHGKPPLPRAKRLRLDSADDGGSTDGKAKKNSQSDSAPSSQEAETATEVIVENTLELDTPSTPSRRRSISKQESPVQRTSPAPLQCASPVPVPAPRTTPKSSRKRKISSQASFADTEEIDTQHSTPLAHENRPSDPTIRIMFTGLDGTIPKLRDKVKKIADACQEDDDVEKVTHLVAPKNQLKRTVKLLCGISCCDHILDERWLDESARSGVPASETLHCLKDANAEAKWNFSLYRTMYNVPKIERRKLFEGLHFFITNHKSVLPPVKELVKIVECAGGHAEIKGTATSDDIVITTEAALPLATTKKAIANATSDRIYTPEFILSGILQQNIDFEAHRLAPQEDSQTSSKKKRGRK